jgi:hypothetical protein
MPKFKPVIRKLEKRSNGTFRIKMRVRHLDAGRYITTDYFVREENFDQDAGKVIASKRA